jgi:hypothetical protein
MGNLGSGKSDAIVNAKDFCKLINSRSAREDWKIFDRDKEIQNTESYRNVYTKFKKKYLKPKENEEGEVTNLNTLLTKKSGLTREDDVTFHKAVKVLEDEYNCVRFGYKYPELEKPKENEEDEVANLKIKRRKLASEQALRYGFGSNKTKKKMIKLLNADPEQEPEQEQKQEPEQEKVQKQEKRFAIANALGLLKVCSLNLKTDIGKEGFDFLSNEEGIPKTIEEVAQSKIPIELKTYLDISKAIENGENIVYESTGRSFDRIKEVLKNIAKSCAGTDEKFFYIGIGLVNIIDPQENRKRLIKRFVEGAQNFANQGLPPLGTRIDIDKIARDQELIKTNIVKLINDCTCPEYNAENLKNYPQDKEERKKRVGNCTNIGLDYIMVYDQKYCKLQSQTPGTASVIVPISNRSNSIIKFTQKKPVYFSKKNQNLLQCIFGHGHDICTTKSTEAEYAIDCGKVGCGETKETVNEITSTENARKAASEKSEIGDIIDKNILLKNKMQEAKNKIKEEKNKATRRRSSRKKWKPLRYGQIAGKRTRKRKH